MTINPEEFMNQPADPMSTAYAVCPEGEYPFLVDSDPAQLAPEEISGTSAKTGKPYHFYKMTLNCVCQDEAVKAKLKLDRVTVRLQLNLDFDEGGKLLFEEGKNIKLGQLREALGQNVPGWTPMQLLSAGPFMGKVAQTSNSNNPEQKYSDIVACVKIS